MDRIIKNHFDRFMKKQALPPEIKDHVHAKNLTLFNDEELLKTWRSNFKGIRYEDKEGNVLFGAVDNILANGKKLIVLDYKTKGFAIKDEKEAAAGYQNQLDIYNYLLRQNGYETEDYAFLLFYIPDSVLETGEVLFHTLLVKREINTKNAEKLFKEALQVLKGDCPEKACAWCEGR